MASDETRQGQTTASDANRAIDQFTDSLLTVEEVAHLLKVPRSWVYERTRRSGREQLPHLKIGKYLRFEERAVSEYLARQRRAS